MKCEPRIQNRTRSFRTVKKSQTPAQHAHRPLRPFGDSLTSAFAKNIAEGKKFDDVLKSVRRSLVETGLKMALAPLQIGLSQSMKELSTGLMGTGSSGEGSGGLARRPRQGHRIDLRFAVRRRAAMRRRPGRPFPVSPMAACSRAAW